MKTRKPRVTATSFLANLERGEAHYVREVLLAAKMGAPELHARTGLPPSSCRSFLNGSRTNPVAIQFAKYITVAREVLGVRL